MDSAIKELDTQTLVLFAIILWTLAKGAAAFITQRILSDRNDLRSDAVLAADRVSKLEKRIDERLNEIESKLDNHITECRIRYEYGQKGQQ